jgi:hypothetical protein
MRQPSIPGVGDAPNANGVDISMQVRKGAPGKDTGKKMRTEPGDVDNRLKELFQRLGGNGTVKVYRYREEDGKRTWCGSIAVSEGLLDTLEEQLARRWGGGDFELHAYHGSEYLGIAQVCIAREIKPQRDADERPAAAAPAAPAIDPLQWMGLLDQREQRAAALAAAQTQAQLHTQQQTMTTLMQIMEQGNQRTMAMMQVMATALVTNQGGAKSDGISQVLQALNLIGKVKEVAGDGQAPMAETTMGERLLGMAIGPIAAKVGDTVANAMAAQVAPRPALPAPAPPSAPTTAAPGVSPVPPRAGHQGPPLPDRSTQVRIPGGATPLSREEMLARAAAARRPGPRPATAPAPATKDVNEEIKR